MELDTAFWADIGEMVSGFAVVITILILTYEIRKNTESNRALSYSQTLDRFNQLRQLLLEQPALGKAIAKYFGEGYRDVEEEERRLIAQYLAYHWSILEGAFFTMAQSVRTVRMAALRTNDTVSLQMCGASSSLGKSQRQPDG